MNTPDSQKSNIFKAYDIRGIYPVEFNEGEAYRIAQTFAEVLNARRVALGRDVRESGTALAAATSQGFRDTGVDVINFGLVPTDAFYFAVATQNVDGGIFISASHNPREWNGMNLSARDAQPISIDYLMPEIEKAAAAKPLVKRVLTQQSGTERTMDILPNYLSFLGSFLKSGVAAMKIAADANFGPQAKVFKALILKRNLPLKLVSINDELDGSFPKGPPNPLLPERRREIIELVKNEKADLGVAWDADGDRCFFVDECGVFHEGYFTNAVLAAEILRMNPGQKILHDPRLTWAIIDTVKACGGIPIAAKPGITRMAKRLREENAVFGGENSSHFYFRDTFYRDNGILPVLLVLQMISRDRKPLSSYYAPLESRYFISGERNFRAEDRDRIVKYVERKYRGGKTEYIDGLSVEFPEWRFGLRPSNTEPLLRLNVEAKKPGLVREKSEEIEKTLFALGAIRE